MGARIDGLSDISFLTLMFAAPAAIWLVLDTISLHLEKKRANLELILRDTRKETRWARALFRIKCRKEAQRLPMQIRLRLANQKKIWYELAKVRGWGVTSPPCNRITIICGMKVEKPWFEPAPGQLHSYRPN